MNKKKFAEYVKGFDFKKLFIELGWDNYKSVIPIAIDKESFELKGIVEKRGFVIVLCPPHSNGEMPLNAQRKKIENHFSKFHQEHLIIYQNAYKTKQVWQFVIQEQDKPKRVREIPYNTEQDPEILYQRARGLLFTLDEEKIITLVDVKARFKENFGKNTETVTKKFYTEFKKQHTSFLNFIAGIDDAIKDEENKNKQWYASLMLNRLMFCYFIQKRGYLDNNLNYLQHKLAEVKKQAGRNKFYNFYCEFLLQLFHQGLGQPAKNRSLTVELGEIPYLNGGLFDVHVLEKQFDSIKIKDDAFEKIFNFFDQWNWTLDIRPDATGKNINPDVIGYIFEKYINDRAAMGAYYTKEDITDYIGKNTIIPFIFDKVKKTYPSAFNNDSSIWKFLKDSSDTYIYDAVKIGISSATIEGTTSTSVEDLNIPENISAGIDTTKPDLLERRKYWNTRTPQGFALPTEIWRETIDRWKRYFDIKSKIEKGIITEINDFITYNLNIRQFVTDVIENTDDPDLIRHFYKAIRSITILDPTCGSGAFLFAALNILEPIYEACIERMEQFTAEAPRKNKFFLEALAEVNSVGHPNLQYYIYKSIILNNLYGVDIMREAVEIAKLRLFLKMVGAVDMNSRKPNFGLEPLPDIDFNIRAGNTLVGFATEEELKETLQEVLFSSDGKSADEKLKEFKEDFQIVATAYKHFQDSQLLTDKGEDSHNKAKGELQKRLNALNDKLNNYLSSTYGIDKENKKNDYQEWLESHQPFHWFAEFYEIVNGNGGFDVVIGNPPYVEYSKVINSYTIKNFMNTNNLYAYTIERAAELNSNRGKVSFIVPMSFSSIRDYSGLRIFFAKEYLQNWVTNHAIRPMSLFTGISQRVSIIIGSRKTKKNFYSTKYYRINTTYKILFETLQYEYADNTYLDQIIPKISNRIEFRIFKKAKEFEKLNQVSTITRKSKYEVYYKDYGETYWLFPFGFKPWLTPIKSFKTLSITSEKARNILTAVFNSSFSYWFYTTTSDCWHFGTWHFFNFPICIEQISNIVINNLLSKNKILMHSFIKNRLSRYDKRIDGNLYEYKISKSKLIIDEIDKILAKHYGFTEEELDFIINYDIKYRMGKELDAYVEGKMSEL